LKEENPPLPLDVVQFVRMLRGAKTDDLFERCARLIQAQAIEIALLRAALQRQEEVAPAPVAGE
jgi:hypothetical protein